MDVDVRRAVRNVCATGRQSEMLVGLLGGLSWQECRAVRSLAKHLAQRQIESWPTRDGRSIRICDLDDGHLLNIIECARDVFPGRRGFQHVVGALGEVSGEARAGVYVAGPTRKDWP